MVERTSIRVETETRDWLHLLADSRKMSLASYLRAIANNTRQDIPAPISLVEVWLSEMERNLSAISLQLMTLRRFLEAQKNNGAETVTLPFFRNELMSSDGRGVLDAPGP